MNDRNAGKLSRREAMILSTAAAAMPALPAMAATNAVADVSAGALPLRDQVFDYGWKFHRGEGAGLEAASYHDADWRSVDLPHDWSIEDLPPGEGRIGPFDPKSVGANNTGFAVGGEGWYRKHFRVDALPAAGRVIINFGGAYMESDVWLNGHHLGNHVNGYTAFSYDLTPHLKRGSDNVLAVRVRNIGQTSRWYSGSGLYRSVTLDIVPQASRVAQWGVGVMTQRITDDHAELAVETRIDSPAPGLTLINRIRDDAGKVAAELSAPAAATLNQTIMLRSPRLWSGESPAMYTLETELCRGNRVIDRVTTPFGVRIVTFDADHGMQVNGKPVKMRGGCVHHDNGVLGAAAYPDADERRVLLLKARGFNALRASVNASSKGFLNACDRHGILLIEELFDMWNVSKTPDDYARFFPTAWRDDLTAMILNARNHPSVVMYSVGNEIPNRPRPDGVAWQWKLANHARSIDPSRPTTAAIHYFPGRLLTADEATARPGFAGVPDHAGSMFLDVIGYNYKPDDYDVDHRKFPKKIFYGSESYPADMFKIWSPAAEQRPYVIGDFVWAAMDYLGETGVGLVKYADTPGPGPIYEPQPWPWITANCCDLDITGGQLAQSYARDVVWGLSPLEMLIQRPPPPGKFERVSKWGWSDELPSWTWPGAEGRPLNVRVYTRATRVDLMLNGKTIDSKTPSGDAVEKVEFSLPYAPGVLEAVAYRGQQEIGRRKLETTGSATAIRLTPEKMKRRAERNGLMFVWVDLTDAQGRPVADAVNKVRLAVDGPAKLIGFGSGSYKATGSFQSSEAETYHGRCLAVLKATGEPGTVSIRAAGTGLNPTTKRLTLA